MRRRELVVALGGALALHGAPVRAQAVAAPRVGWLSGASKAIGGEILDILVDGLAALGYRPDRDYVLDARWADFSGERVNRLARELADAKPAVIVAQGTAVQSVLKLVPPVPMVFTMSGDPVAAGVATSLRQPGGHATGVSHFSFELVDKRVDFLRQFIPGLKRIAFLANPEHPGEHRERAAALAAAGKMQLEPSYFEARDVAAIAATLPRIAAAKVDALVVFGDTLMLQERRTLARFLLAQRLPGVSSWAEFTASGFLFTYGPDRRASWRRLASFVDRILKGAKPSELPIELPTAFEVAVSRRTAGELGLAIPPPLLVQAKHVFD